MKSCVDLFFEDVSTDEDEAERKKTQMRRIRKTIRDSSNPLELPDSIFVSNFRLNKNAKNATRVANEFDLGLSKSTVSVVLSEVLEIFESTICPVLIKVDLSETEKQAARQYFYIKSRMPGVIGCVDGTHIGIVAPVERRHEYLNREGFYSVNALIACDHNMVIRYIDARYPGSKHDSFVWNCSHLKHVLEEWFQKGERSMYLGDSGYPLSPYLLVPFRNADNDSRKTLFNKLHSESRNIVKRTIGVPL